jgi:type II secretory ATPase GspE/PulE/Tfp pilus assembly ATPase PilB-like protein
MASAHTTLENILLKRSWISAHGLKRARQYRRPGQSLVDSLIEIRVVDPRRLAYALAEASCLPFQTRLDESTIDGQLLAKMGISYARKNRILPLGTDGANVVVAAADPSKYEPLDDLGVLFGMPVQPVIVPFDVIDRVIVRTNGRSFAAGLIINLEEQQLEPAVSQLERMPLDLLSAATPPVIRLITALLWRAVNDQARGIQVESLERELLVRFRTDEALYDVMSSPKCYERALVSRLKEMAGLRVADGRFPQSGDMRLRIAGRVVAGRISTMPGSFGEGIVLRLPDSEHELVDIIENCVDALSGLAADTTGPPSCWHCGEPIVVASALFCKDCGVKLIDIARLAQVG